MSRILFTLLAVLLLLSPQLSHTTLAAPPAQQPACRFFTETGGGQGGYSVCDDGAARFRSAFDRWGLQKIGYPISQRYEKDGFVMQAFQKAIMQWRPESNTVVLSNIFDDLHNAGFDEQLNKVRQTPTQFPAGWDGEGLSFQQVVAKRQALLDARPALRRAYFASADPLTFFGLPTSEVTDMGNHYAIRLQRAVLQEWKETVPWARAGEVTIANGGDIAKELGGLPVAALVPQTQGVPSAPPAPTATVPSASSPPSSAPLTLTGSGTGITVDFQLPRGVLVAKSEYTGPSNFVVWLKNSATAENEELIANEIGNFSGEKVFVIAPGSYFMDVYARGPWSVTIMTPQQRPTQPSANSYRFEGTGRGVPWMFTLRGGRVDYSVSYTGARNFIIWAYNVSTGDREELLVNEIGNYSSSGSFSARGGLYMLDVEASGPWSITLNQR